MAQKVKLDKDTVLEFLETRKDVLFISILVLLLLYGGWFLYQQSAQSVDQIIQKAIQNPDRSGGKADDSKVVIPEEVVTTLVTKRPRTMYDVQKSPFGSPQEQLRIRDELQKTYNRAVELFNANDFPGAIEQFKKVIALDVTESRITYQIQPSEYMRRAQREYLKTNFSGMLTSAENDIKEGDRFMTGSQLQEAEKVYSRANKTLSDALAADPDGAAVGKENFSKIQSMQQSVFQKWQTVQTTVLKNEIQKSVTQAQQLLGQQDLVALTKSWIQLNQVGEHLNLVDPNAAIITQDQRQPMISLVNSINEKLKTGFADLVSQAETQFNQALAEKDLTKTKETVAVMRLAINLNPQDKTLPQKIGALVAARAKLVLELVDQFIAQQQQIIDKQQFDQFDADGKVKFLDELAALRALGTTALANDLRTQLADRETKLKRDIRKPPLLTEGYDIIEISKGASDKWKIVVRDKVSRTGSLTKTLNLSVGGRDTSTQISLTQVDTEKGFVILSKPGYSATEVKINQNK